MPEFLRSEWKRLSASARVIILCAVTTITLSFLIMLPKGGSAQQAAPQQALVQEELLPSDAQSDTNEMYIRWGDSQFTTGDEYECAWPAQWALAAYKTGRGEWSTNNDRTCWHVPASASETNSASTRLNIVVDRLMLTNDAILELSLIDSTNADLRVSLFDTNETVIVEDLFGNLLTGSDADTAMYLDVPFEMYPAAAGISMRGNGEITVYESLLYVDRDHDGLDADQEAQLGTSDLVGNGGNAPQVRMPRVIPPCPPALVSTSSPAISAETPASTNAAGNAGNGTNSVVKPSPSVSGRIVYVDRQIGSDTLSGKAMAIVGNDGPKLTIGAGLAEAGVNPGSTLVIKSGKYGENLNIAGKNISVVIQGSVDISGHSGGINVPPPVAPNPSNVVGVITNSVGN